MTLAPPEGLALTTFGAARDADGGPALLAVHGITANGMSWDAVAAHLPGRRILAPDLRGRGRSNVLPGPYGLRRHADDLARLLERDGGGGRVVMAHSMGAFVGVLLAASRPELVERLVLVDGGFPLALPQSGEIDIAQALGPAAARLSMEFADDDAYLAYWRVHPAFARDWSPAVEAYARYDLDGEAPHRHPSAIAAAMLEDGAELYGPDWYVAALRALRMPVTVLRAPRGLTDAAPLYEPGALEGFRDLVPGLEVVEVDDVNHYTILFADRGAAAVAAAVDRHPSPSRSAKEPT